MKNKTILIVEDDLDILKNLGELLESEDFQIMTARNGVLALEALSRSTSLPDLILLDLMMPVMDGFRFREAQLADSRIAGIPLLVMTATGHVDAAQKEMAGVPFIRKPLEIDSLLALIEKIIGAV